MDVFVMLCIGLFVAIPASIPGLLLWKLANKYLPKAYSMPQKTMTAICAVLSFLSGYYFDLELEEGILSMFVAMLVFVFLWSTVLILICSISKYIKKFVVVS